MRSTGAKGGALQADAEPCTKINGKLKACYVFIPHCPEKSFFLFYPLTRNLNHDIMVVRR
jgi:hypothetical protein